MEPHTWPATVARRFDSTIFEVQPVKDLGGFQAGLNREIPVFAASIDFDQLVGSRDALALRPDDAIRGLVPWPIVQLVEMPEDSNRIIAGHDLIMIIRRAAGTCDLLGGPLFDSRLRGWRISGPHGVYD